jgi:hypothetical protein
MIRLKKFRDSYKLHSRFISRSDEEKEIFIVLSHMDTTT